MHNTFWKELTSHIIWSLMCKRFCHIIHYTTKRRQKKTKKNRLKCIEFYVNLSIDWCMCLQHHQTNEQKIRSPIACLNATHLCFENNISSNWRITTKIIVIKCCCIFSRTNFKMTIIIAVFKRCLWSISETRFSVFFIFASNAAKNHRHTHTFNEKESLLWDTITFFSDFKMMDYHGSEKDMYTNHLTCYKCDHHFIHIFFSLQSLFLSL